MPHSSTLKAVSPCCASSGKKTRAVECWASVFSKQPKNGDSADMASYVRVILVRWMRVICVLGNAIRWQVMLCSKV